MNRDIEATPGAKPGQEISSGPGWRWIVYEWTPGRMCAALYVTGHLLRHDLRGWWVAGYDGKRRDVKGDPVARLGHTVPAGWPLHPEQLELIAPELT